MNEMEELKRDMRREEQYQKVRRGLMAFCFGAGLAAAIASPDWKQAFCAIFATVIAEAILGVLK